MEKKLPEDPSPGGRGCLGPIPIFSSVSLFFSFASWALILLFIFPRRAIFYFSIYSYILCLSSFATLDIPPKITNNTVKMVEKLYVTYNDVRTSNYPATPP